MYKILCINEVFLLKQYNNIDIIKLQFRQAYRAIYFLSLQPTKAIDENRNKHKNISFL